MVARFLASRDDGEWNDINCDGNPRRYFWRKFCSVDGPIRLPTVTPTGAPSEATLSPTPELIDDPEPRTIIPTLGPITEVASLSIRNAEEVLTLPMYFGITSFLITGIGIILWVEKCKRHELRELNAILLEE